MELKWVSGTSTPWYRTSLARHGTRPPPSALRLTQYREQTPRPSAIRSVYREQIQVQRTHTQASEAPSLLRSGAICVGSSGLDGSGGGGSLTNRSRLQPQQQSTLPPQLCCRLAT